MAIAVMLRGANKPKLAKMIMNQNMTSSSTGNGVPLGLLAPELVESICAGNPPASLSAERLKTVGGVPNDWAVQQQALCP